MRRAVATRHRCSVRSPTLRSSICGFHRRHLSVESMSERALVALVQAAHAAAPSAVRISATPDPALIDVSIGRSPRTLEPLSTDRSSAPSVG